VREHDLCAVNGGHPTAHQSPRLSLDLQHLYFTKHCYSFGSAQLPPGWALQPANTYSHQPPKTKSNLLATKHVCEDFPFGYFSSIKTGTFKIVLVMQMCSSIMFESTHPCVASVAVASRLPAELPTAQQPVGLRPAAKFAGAALSAASRFKA
jgi:hypothetical protein